MESLCHVIGAHSNIEWHSHQCEIHVHMWFFLFELRADDAQKKRNIGENSFPRLKQRKQSIASSGQLGRHDTLD